MDLLQDGQLDNKKCEFFNSFKFIKKSLISAHFFNSVDKNSMPSKKSTKLAVAVCIKVHLKAYSSETIDMALVWNMPKFRFINGKTIHNRLGNAFLKRICIQKFLIFKILDSTHDTLKITKLLLKQLQTTL
jgi:hypothetical protein